MTPSRVAVVHDADYNRAIPTALDRLGDLAPLFADRRVAIKPNDTWASADDLTACSQADTVRAAIRAIKRYSPREIIVSGGSGAGETDRIFHLLGIDRVLEEEEVEFFDHNRPPFQEVALDYGPQGTVMVNPRVLEYDTLVSLAQLKVHHSATVTLCLKNVAMSYPAADFYGHPRSQKLHSHFFFQDLQSFIVGMCQKFPIHLGIVAGHPAMVGKGPIGGHTFEADLTLAGLDAVAVDAVGAHLLSVPEVRHLQEAAALGLGTADLAKIEIVGEDLELARQRFRQQVEATASQATIPLHFSP